MNTKSMSVGGPLESRPPSGAFPVATGSAARRRFVTVVYEITDDKAWRDGGNPLQYEHHGLKSVCISAGDLATFVEELEAHIKDDGDDIEAKYDELHTKHIMASFPGR